MSWQPQANRQDILSNAKVAGYSVNGYYSIPAEWSVVTSGGASKSSSQKGTELSGGTTAGDTASVQTAQTYVGRSIDNYRTEWIFETRGTSAPSTDSIKIGRGMDSDPTIDSGTYLDLQATELSIRGTKIPLTVTIGSFNAVGLCIDYDFSADETAVEVRTKGGNQVERVATDPNNLTYGVHVQSNGGGESIALLANTLSMAYDWEI